MESVSYQFDYAVWLPVAAKLFVCNWQTTYIKNITVDTEITTQAVTQLQQDGGITAQQPYSYIGIPPACNQRSRVPYCKETHHKQVALTDSD